MGVNWARTGAAVLVPDVLGHGERAQQPFGGRQDYYSRYFINMHFSLVGESYLAWIVWDLMRGTDLLLTLPGIDRERIILIGAVAGGGDPSAVAAAFDPRVTCSIPYNFGAGAGWRTHLRTPTPPGRNLAGVGYWELTRNLPLTARGGFFPWVLVAAVAPRYLVSAHEFEWDADKDEAWHRIQKVYDFYDARDRLGWCKGAGACEPGAGNTHCTNVGPIHRAGFYPYLERWFGMRPPVPEVQKRREPAELVCLDEATRRRMKTVRQLMAEKADGALATVRRALGALPPDARRRVMCERWTRLLGETAPASEPRVEVRSTTALAGAAAERMFLEVESGVAVPLILLRPDAESRKRAPVVIGVAQQGKDRFIRVRAVEITDLLDKGIAVCLPDVRGVGETSPGDERGRKGPAIAAHTDELMLGRHLLGLQLSDLRCVLQYLRTRPDLDASRLALWGDSFAPVNPPDFIPPRQEGDGLSPVDDGPAGTDRPPVGEPLGLLLALLGALFEDHVRAVLGRHGIAAFASAFDGYYLNIPLDCVVPEMLLVGDVDDLAAGLAPKALRIEGLVDACNRPVGAELRTRWLRDTTRAYSAKPDHLHLAADPAPASDWLAGWLS